MHGRDLEGSNARKNVVERVLIVIVRDKLAVDLLLEPRFWNTVHYAIGVGHLGFDGSRCISEKLRVFSFVMARVPLVS